MEVVERQIETGDNDVFFLTGWFEALPDCTEASFQIQKNGVEVLYVDVEVTVNSPLTATIITVVGVTCYVIYGTLAVAKYVDDVCAKTYEFSRDHIADGDAIFKEIAKNLVNEFDEFVSDAEDMVIKCSFFSIIRVIAEDVTGRKFSKKGTQSYIGRGLRRVKRAFKKKTA